MVADRRSRLSRLARVGRYLIEDAGGIVADLAYAVRDVVVRRGTLRHGTRRRGRQQPRRGRT